MFEPSDTWKQTHVTRPNHSDGCDVSHFSSPYIRRGRRDDYEPMYYPPVGGDRYRPSQSRHREPYPHRRKADTYRPQYDGTWASPNSHDVSPPRSIGSFKREPSSGYTNFSAPRLPSRDRSNSQTPPHISSAINSRTNGPYNRESTGGGNRSFSDSIYISQPYTAPRFNDEPPPRKKFKSRSSSWSSAGSRAGTFEKKTARRKPPNSYRPVPSRPILSSSKVATTSKTQIRRSPIIKANQKQPGYLEEARSRVNVGSGLRPDTRSASPATSIGMKLSELFYY
jgi:hypothetical protein